MIIGILKEPSPERRVVCLPETVAQLIGLKTKVLVESGAGNSAYASDDTYKQAGAEISTASNILSEADLILRIAALTIDEVSQMKSGAAVVAVLQPLFNKELVNA